MSEQAEAKDIDRSEWGPGPWDGEPDRVEWRSRGFACLARRTRMGAWCGYVAMPPGHPWHGKEYGEPDVDVHGGLTYANKCSGDICHVPAPGEPADVWWLGFDCSHSNDLSPSMSAHWRKHHPELSTDAYDVYRDLAYVKAEVEKLAEQAEAAR